MQKILFLKPINKNIRNNNSGMAIVILLACLGISFLLIISIFSQMDNLTLMVSNNFASEDALNIAEAGYNRYLWCLNDDSYFYKTGTNVSLAFVPDTYYTAFDNPLWDGIPKDYEPVEYKRGNTLIGYYKISIIPPTVQNPEITLKSTGWNVNYENIKRTIQVKIFKKKFTNFVDFSNDMKTSDGSNVSWGTGEEIRGPLFTNGTLRTSGVPIFHNTVGYVIGTSYSGGSPQFNLANQPEQKTALIFPGTNSTLKFWGNTANGGYTYSGRTCILLNGIAGNDNDTSATALKIRNKTNGDVVETLPIPASRVIYVTGDVFVSGILDGRLTILSERSIYLCGKDPTNFTPATATNTGGITYANQNIPVSSSDALGNPSNDMLGLVAQTKVVVNTIQWPDSSAGGINSGAGYASVAINNIKVQCALFGLGGTAFYGVDAYAGLRNVGSIYLIGSKIASRMGGTWNGGLDGYKENNSFDYRMRYDSPPFFLEPTNSGWEIRDWTEGIE